MGKKKEIYKTDLRVCLDKLDKKKDNSKILFKDVQEKIKKYIKEDGREKVYPIDCAHAWYDIECELQKKIVKEIDYLKMHLLSFIPADLKRVYYTHILDTLDRVIDVMYKELLNEKQRHIDEKKMRGRHDEFKKQR